MIAPCIAFPDGGAPDGILPQLRTLATDEIGVMNIAADEENVYWLSYDGDRTVSRAPVRGGESTVVMSGNACGRGLAIDRSNFYFSVCDGTVWRAPLGCAPVKPVEIASGQSIYIESFVVTDGRRVYWAHIVEDDAGNDTSSIRSVPIDGGSVVTHATVSDWVTAMAVDSHNVYWGAGLGQLTKVPVSGGPPTVLWPGSGHEEIRAIAVDSSNVYWAAVEDTPPLDGVILQIPIDGGAIVTLSSGEWNPAGIAVDSANVYWTDFAYGGHEAQGGLVKKAPIGGGSVTTLATGQCFPATIAVNSASVFWATECARYEGYGLSTVMQLTLK